MQTSHQVRRVIRMLVLFSNGQRLTTSELADRVSAMDDGKDVTIRQIQRDLRSIESSGVPLLSERDGKELRWSIPSGYRAMTPLNVSSNELLALHMLKGLLLSFRDTRIARDLTQLATKLERLAPGTVFLHEDLVSDVSPGRYATAVADDVLEQIIVAIVDPHWDRVTYRSIHGSTTKTFVVSFCRLVNHAGRLYVAAWHPTYGQYITLAADRIDHVERANDIVDPIHLFSEQRYRNGRFGVFDGDVRRITIRIDASAADFFMSRIWHPSQEFHVLRTGDATLTLNAPVSPELVSWIVGWADVMTVRSPKSLIAACQAKVKAVNNW